MESNTPITRKTFPIDKNDPKMVNILRAIAENNCRTSALRSVINMVGIPAETVTELAKEYVDEAVKREMMFVDYIRNIIPDDCIEVVHWDIDVFHDCIVICGRYREGAKSDA